MSTDNFSFYQKLFSKLNVGLNTYWSDVASRVIDAITPTATMMITLYVMLWGWSMMRGVISEPITDGIGRIVRLSLISSVALNIGYYNGFLADLLWQSPEALGSIIASEHSSPINSVQFLDKLLSSFFDLSELYHQKAHADTGVMEIPDLVLLFIGVVLLLAGILVTGYAAFLFVLSKISLAILIGIGPLFVLFTIFEPTKQFFNMWLGQAINYVFVVFLTAGVVKLFMIIIQSYLGSADVLNSMSDPSVNQAIPAIVLSFICLLVMVRVPEISASLGSGAAVSTLGVVRWGYRSVKNRVRSLPLRPTPISNSYQHLKSGIQSDVQVLQGMYRKISGRTRNRTASAQSANG